VQAHALVTAMREAKSDADRRRLAGELGDLLREHIRWEEATLFEATQQVLDAGALERLGTDLADRLPAVPPAPPWYPKASP
jgi:hypothetical protein